jgi:hypothetical protein
MVWIYFAPLAPLREQKPFRFHPQLSAFIRGKMIERFYWPLSAAKYF